jgi:hypothetical protein
MTMQQTQFGTVLERTMRSEDLIPAFVDELKYLYGEDPIPENVAKTIADADAVTDFDADETPLIVDELFESLNELAPAYGYFGAHPGDGSDYGFWLHEDFQQMILDGGGASGDETPDKRTLSGEFLHINDHGNCTLFAWANGKWAEVWAVV